MIRFATRLIIRLIGLAVLVLSVVFLLFYFEIGPFEQNPISIDSLKSTYCVDEVNPAKCECIVRPIEVDMANRWTPTELDYLKQHGTQMAYAVTRSFEAVRDQIEGCLKDRGEEEALDEVLQELIPVNQKWLNKLGEWKDDLAQKADSALDSAQSKKDWVDEHYN